MSSTLYYSERCKFCKQLMKKLESSSNSYKLANVDFLMDYPREVTRVPTLIMKDPSTSKSTILIGKAIFEYLDKSNSKGAANVSNSVNYSDGNNSMLHVDVPNFKGESGNDFVYLQDSSEESLHPIGSSFKYIQQSNAQAQPTNQSNALQNHERSASQLDKQLEELQRTRT